MSAPERRKLPGVRHWQSCSRAVLSAFRADAQPRRAANIADGQFEAADYHVCIKYREQKNIKDMRQEYPAPFLRLPGG